MTFQINSYYLLTQLSDDVKIKNKIKVGAAVPRYDCVESEGYYPEMERLVSTKGDLHFYLCETKGVINSPDQRRADRFLQAAKSFNFSSVYLLDEQTADGHLIGYGNPNGQKTYGKGKIPNPFWECRNDGFLFIISPDWKNIELLVMPNGKFTILGLAKALADGQFDEALDTIRATAKTFYQY